MDISNIENTTKEILEKMGWDDASVVINDKKEDGVEVLIKTYDAKYLIGSGGQNLKALERLLKVLVGKRFSYKMPLILDINEYRREREKQIRELAREVAQKVSHTKSPVRLPPMDSADRKIVHTELASRPDVITESEGEDLSRSVVIKPNN
ncbi:hypothetical protein C4553_03165 [Candidatus Parcubacteria bacterium]|nr:MAG: hypothetical protein C4553_03165 [Candidatus Parcubacteria bacterium]